MARIHTFRALRPTPESAFRVAAVPYDVVSREEAAALAAANSLSFLHVSRAEIDLPAAIDAYADEVYTTAVANFWRIRRAAPLVVEDLPSLYFYRLEMGDHQQTGLAACFSLDEYDHDRIKRHERTRRDKEDDRTRHMVALRAQTGPVFLTYRASAEIDVLAGRLCSDTPLLAFRAADGVHHSIWKVTGQDATKVVQAFASVPALYIADGHHRAASAARAREQLRSAALATAPELARDVGVAEHDAFLAVAFPHNQVQILSYNRAVRDLAGRSPEELVHDLKTRFRLNEGSPVPTRKGEVSMYLAGKWYAILLDAAAGSSADQSGETSLDVTALQEQVLKPFLSIGDVRTDKRIEFVGGARGTAELERLVNVGRAAAAFSMFPVTVDDLMAAADAGGIMPPKSTWFEPKLRDGLLTHLI